MAQKEKVAILGAGLGGLSTAYGLSATPELREKYDITVYQVGWRAGGQCATGRVGEQNRIDQNGTHYLFGCYDNMLSISKEVYEELGAQGAKDFGEYDKSLLPRDLLAMKHFFRGKWELWPLPLPNNSAEPGKDTGWLTPPEYLSMFLQAFVSLIFGIDIGRFLRPASPFGEKRPAWLMALYTILWPVLFVVAWVLWAIGIFLFRLGQDLLWLFGDPDYLTVAKIMSLFRGINRFLFGFLARRFHFFFRIFTIGDFACTAIIGLIRDRVPALGLGAIEPKEFRSWLREHGANELTIYAPFIGTWYDAVAAYEEGDPNRPNLSAGVSVMSVTKALLSYKGHFAYQMRAEMGDTIIGPLYACLKQRGVKFKFFHRVRDIVPNAEDEIDQIVIEQQVTMKSGDPESYDPLRPLTVEAGTFQVWPNEPLWDQIVETPPDPPENLESFYTKWRGKDLPPLKRGVDFDQVVIAMPVATFPTYCAKLLKKSDKWKNMAHYVSGVETQTMRLYFDASLDELGWTMPTPILSNFAIPFSTWEDNGHLVEVETWPKDRTPKAIATVFGALPAPEFCPPASQSSYPADQQKVAQRNIEIFMEDTVGSLWPGSTTIKTPPAIDWPILVDLENRVGPERLRAQSIRANSGPNQRYIMAKADTSKHRLSSEDSQFRNLYLAGDWTANHFLIGSIEGAVMSGLQASRAMSGYPEKIPGEDTGL